MARGEEILQPCWLWWKEIGHGGPRFDIIAWLEIVNSCCDWQASVPVATVPTDCVLWTRDQQCDCRHCVSYLFGHEVN